MGTNNSLLYHTETLLDHYLSVGHVVLQHYNISWFGFLFQVADFQIFEHFPKYIHCNLFTMIAIQNSIVKYSIARIKDLTV